MVSLKLAQMSAFPTRNKKPTFGKKGHPELGWKNPKLRRTVDVLFEKYEQVGIIPFEQGCVVIDLDVKDGHDGVGEYKKKFGSPPKTMWYKTRSGGVHLWFFLPKASIKQRNGALPGVDIRYSDGYVCVGRDYEIHNDGLFSPPPFDVLDWLITEDKKPLESLGNANSIGYSGDGRPKRFNLSPIPKGSRNETMFRWGFGLFQNVLKGTMDSREFHELMTARGTNSGLSPIEIENIEESIINS